MFFIGLFLDVHYPYKDDNRIAMVYFSDRREVKRATEATDGRFLFSAIIDVYDQTLSEKQYVKDYYANQF